MLRRADMPLPLPCLPGRKPITGSKKYKYIPLTACNRFPVYWLPAVTALGRHLTYMQSIIASILAPGKSSLCFTKCIHLSIFSFLNLHSPITALSPHFFLLQVFALPFLNHAAMMLLILPFCIIINPHQKNLIGIPC